MSDYNKDSILVKCPFYKGQDPCKIYCEGLQENSSIILSFGDKREKESYRNHFCQQRFKYCKLYFLNDIKYDETGDLRQ